GALRGSGEKMVRAQRAPWGASAAPTPGPASIWRRLRGQAESARASDGSPNPEPRSANPDPRSPVSGPLSLPQRHPQDLVRQPRGEEVAGGVAGRRGELDQVGADDVFGGEEVFEQREGGVPAASTRLGGAGCGCDRGIEEIEVEGQEDVVGQ